MATLDRHGKMDQDQTIDRPVEPASARVSIFEVTPRPWGELVTDARRPDDRVFVGMPEWRRGNKTP
jgi:hypothetical protein